MSSDETNISVVTVTYNSSHLIGNFLSTLLGNETTSHDHVVVVDSGSADSAATKTIAENHGVTFIGSTANVGYGTGSNLGARDITTKWVAFVNPDVEVTLEDLKRLADSAERNGYQCIGPTVVDEDDRPQVSWHGIAAPPWRPARFAPETSGDTFATPSISGCCMVFERHTFERLKGFDEAFFMFCEEIDLHKRLAEIGGRVGVTSSVVVKTPGGASSLGITKRWSNVERSIAHVQFFSKHYTWPEALIDVIWRAFLICTQRTYQPKMDSLRHFVRGLARIHENRT